MPPAERRAVLSLLLLALAGQGLRYFFTRPGDPPGQIQLLATLSPGSVAAQRDSAMAQGRPLRPGETVDVDRASLVELTRLPKVGPRLAKTILADRARQGAFGSLAGLDRVSGIGPGLLHTLEPHVTFSGTAAQMGSSAVAALSPIAHARAEIAAPLPSRPAAPLNLNSATLQQLDSLPGVGLARAAAIVQYRQDHGPFTRIEQLAAVPGFGPAAVSRLQQRLAVP